MADLMKIKLQEPSQDEGELLKTIREILQNGDKVDPDVSRRLQLALSLENHVELKKINGRLKKVETVTDELMKKPPLLYLLHTKPRKTIMTILGILAVLFLLFALAFHYGVLPKVIEWLGLPPIV